MCKILLLLLTFFCISFLLPTVYASDNDDFDITVEALSPPTSLELSITAESNINVSWVKADGADTTYFRRKQDSYPTDRTDGDLVYNSTGSMFDDEAVTVGNHHYYRAWSYNVTSNEYSVETTDNHILVLQPALFDIRDITILDSVISELDIVCIVENEGGVEADITVTWYLSRVDTSAVLDSGSDTFAVSAGAETIYRIYPSTSYIGSVSILFSGENASATEIFTTSEVVAPPAPPGGGGGGVPPSARDSDDDGLTDAQEEFYGTDPNKKDTDGDGWSDYDEIQKGTDPLNPGDYPEKIQISFMLIIIIIGSLIVSFAMLIFVIFFDKRKKKKTA